jgi:hypothetical protein
MLMELLAESPGSTGLPLVVQLETEHLDDFLDLFLRPDTGISVFFPFHLF